AIASSEASSPRVTLAARVPNCLTASPAASEATVAVRRTREVGIFSLSRAMPLNPRGRGPALAGPLHARAGHDVIAAVGPAHPRLRAAVVVAAEQNQRRRLAERGAWLGALGIETP